MGTATGTPRRLARVLRSRLRYNKYNNQEGATLGTQTPAILSVLGEDRVGIVAGVSRALAEANANIEDIRQTIISGVFSMTMLITVDEGVVPFDELQRRLTEVGNEIGVQITLQREDVFRFMHRV
ncbi:MAG: ACT domain-containing protein [Actinobacteria bacterium HGW-Actinobacteria-10]|nr:MAG: ACT domain-containing protein [Actinobacteria bacterium HGW-Actinobacteria-10]